MKISLIIPVYNTERTYLEECLNSLKDQSGADCEFLLIDDGSREETARYLDGYASADKRFRVFHKTNGGVSSARNLGLDQADGDYIGFVDSDDILEPDALKLCVDSLKKTGADLCVFPCRQLFDGKPLAPLTATGGYSVLTGKMRDQFMAGYYLGAYVWSKLIRRGIACSVRFREDVPLQEDLLYLWELLPRVGTAVCMDDPLYRYRMHTASAVHTAGAAGWFSASERLAPIVEEAKAENCLSAPTLLERTLSGLCKAAAATGKGCNGDRSAMRGQIRNTAKKLRAGNRDILSLKSRLALFFLIGFPWALPLMMRVFRLIKRS